MKVKIKKLVLSDNRILDDQEMKVVYGGSGPDGDPDLDFDPEACYDAPYGSAFHPCEGKKVGDSCSYYRWGRDLKFHYKSGTCTNNGWSYKMICQA